MDDEDEEDEDEDEEDEDDEDEEEEVENDVNSIKELLLDFYPILRTTANGAMSNPCDDILNEILIPYFRK